MRSKYVIKETDIFRKFTCLYQFLLFRNCSQNLHTFVLTIVAHSDRLMIVDISTLFKRVLTIQKQNAVCKNPAFEKGWSAWN